MLLAESLPGHTVAVTPLKRVWRYNWEQSRTAQERLESDE